MVSRPDRIQTVWGLCVIALWVRRRVAFPVSDNGATETSARAVVVGWLVWSRSQPNRC